MRSVITLALLLLVAAIAVGAPESHAAASSALDLRGIVLLTITVVVFAFEGLRRLP